MKWEGKTGGSRRAMVPSAKLPPAPPVHHDARPKTTAIPQPTPPGEILRRRFHLDDLLNENNCSGVKLNNVNNSDLVIIITLLLYSDDTVILEDSIFYRAQSYKPFLNFVKLKEEKDIVDRYKYFGWCHIFI